MDFLPKRSIGKKDDGSFAYESLINKRILIGADTPDQPGNPHIESSNTELSDNLLNGNLLKSEVNCLHNNHC